MAADAAQKWLHFSRTPFAAPDLRNSRSRDRLFFTRGFLFMGAFVGVIATPWSYEILISKPRPKIDATRNFFVIRGFIGEMASLLFIICRISGGQPKTILRFRLRIPQNPRPRNTDFLIYSSVMYAIIVISAARGITLYDALIVIGSALIFTAMLHFLLLFFIYLFLY